jgi:UDP-N-acetylglucosamine:LPS N-acetylglucosamine transferase
MARDQALAMGHSPERVFLTSGMILHPKYYQPVEVDRTRDLETLGLDPKRPTALMMFGGEGSAKMLEIARLLNASSLDLQIIAICGKNEKLCSQFRDMPRRIPVHIEGFTREVPKFMKLSDFFIGKPGPGSISEAMIMGLPVIVECNAWTLPQERYNATWVEERGVGIALKSFRSGIVEAVRRMVDETQRRAFTTRVNSIQNRAVFEIPEILAAILAKH